MSKVICKLTGLNDDRFTIIVYLLCRHVQPCLSNRDIYFSFTELVATWRKKNKINDTSYQWHQPPSHPVKLPVVTRTLGNPVGQKGPFTCPTCYKTYSHKSNLGRHKRLECGKEPQFQCPFCPQRTTQNSSLRKHIERHHVASNTGCLDFNI